MTTIAEQVIPREIPEGDPGITVYCIDGSSFRAPSRGPVMLYDYPRSLEETFTILSENIQRQELDNSQREIEKRHTECLKVKKIDKENEEYYHSLPKFYEIPRKPPVRRRRRK